MSGNKTWDGVKLTKIVKAARNIPGITVRQGSKHLDVLNYPGLEPCPIATSTNCRKMVVPWMKQIVDYRAKEIYAYLKKGKWA